jgi:energy-coupling factor transporter ATP-binding protein EcfA2
MLSGVAFSVRDEVAFGPANLGWPRERIRHAVDAALELTGTVHLAERDPATLSGGELQRVMLAGVVALEPEVLLLDEPTAELDAEGTERFYHLARALAQAATVLIATTDVDRAAGVAGRVVVLERGRVVADGSPADALGDPRVVAVDCSTSAAVIARDAGFAAPYPVTVDALLTRVAH